MQKVPGTILYFWQFFRIKHLLDSLNRMLIWMRHWFLELTDADWEYIDQVSLVAFGNHDATVNQPGN